jgi:hypothetical protein
VSGQCRFDRRLRAYEAVDSAPVTADSCGISTATVSCRDVGGVTSASWPETDISEVEATAVSKDSPELQAVNRNNVDLRSVGRWRYSSRPRGHPLLIGSALEGPQIRRATRPKGFGIARRMTRSPSICNSPKTECIQRKSLHQLALSVGILFPNCLQLVVIGFGTAKSRTHTLPNRVPRAICPA